MNTLEVIPKDMTVKGKRVTVESDTTLRPVPTLEALANVIRHEHALVEKAAQGMLDHAVKCGNALIEARRQVKRGEWQKWVADNLTMPQGTVNFYLRMTFYADVLQEADVHTWEAARRFLRDNRLEIQQLGAYPDETVAKARELYKAGMIPRVIGEHLGVPYRTVEHWVKGDRRKGVNKRPRNAWGRRVRGRKRDSSRAIAITDDLVEGMAIWLCHGDPKRVDDAVRERAGEALRAAFAYDGPIPSENG